MKEEGRSFLVSPRPSLSDLERKVSQSCGDPMFLSVFRKNLDGIHHGIIDHGYKREVDSAAGGRLDMVEGLYDRRRAALREDVKVLHQHFAVGGNVKYP